MFSPHYARALANGPTCATEHLALNVALYGKRRAWAFVEGKAGPGALSAQSFQLGESRCVQHAHGLTLDVCAPRGLGQAPLRGQVELSFGETGSPRPFLLDGRAQHRWWPRAPVARVKVSFPGEGVDWQGDAYHDLNWGHEPLAAGFSSWQWMRELHAGTGEVNYQALLAQNRGERAMRLVFDGMGGMRRAAPQRAEPLRTSRWGILRAAPGRWTVAATLEDTPFYARSLLQRGTAARPVRAIHEALDMRRWQRPWVRFLLPFRLRRLAARGPANHLL